MQNNMLGQYLKNLRRTYGYTQEYVASQLNIIHQTYSHYETGRIIPPTDALYNLAKLYHIPPEELMRLAVTHNDLSDDTQIPISSSSMELSNFLEYIEAPSNQKKFKYLTRREKLFLYYYQQLDFDHQDEMTEILKIKYNFQKKRNAK